MRHADDGDLLDGGMLEEEALDLDRRDVLAAADDHVLDAVSDFRIAVGMDDGSVAGVKIAVADRQRRRLGVLVVALHDHVAAHHDLTGGDAVVRDLVAFLVDDEELTGRDELDSLTRLERRALLGREPRVLRSRLTHGDERRRLGQAVDVGDLPAQLAFDARDGGGGRRRAGREDPHAARCAQAELVGRARDADEHRGRRAQHGDRLLRELGEDLRGLDAPQAHVGAADRGDDPREGPAVGVEHRERPEVALAGRHVDVDEGADRVEIRIAVGDHHALGARGRAARVIDGEEICLGDHRPLDGDGCARRRDRGELLFVVEPSRAHAGGLVAHVGLVLERDEVPDVRDAIANGVDDRLVFGRGADDGRAAVPDDVREVVGDEPVVDGHEHRAELRDGVE